MSIIYIDEVRYICRLHNGQTVLNPYTPIAFSVHVTPSNTPTAAELDNPFEWFLD
jgi:hypothetical protein